MKSNIPTIASLTQTQKNIGAKLEQEIRLKIMNEIASKSTIIISLKN
jgi:hypothetical protein